MNTIKTVGLLTILTLLLVFGARLFSGPSAVPIALVFAAVMNFGSWWFSDRIALSTRFAGMVGGVVALIFWGVAWIGGIVGGVGAALDNATATHVGTATRLILPTDGMWRGAVWSLEPATIVGAVRSTGAAAAGNPFFAAEPPETLYLAWTVAWVALGLFVTVWLFSRREI